LLWLALAGALGTLGELVLTAHWGDALQLIPFAMAGLLAVWSAALLAGRDLHGTRLVMPLVMASSIAGGVLHARGNRAFEVEVHPNASWVDQGLAAATGAAPLLAPGILALVAALIWLVGASGRRSP